MPGLLPGLLLLPPRRSCFFVRRRLDPSDPGETLRAWVVAAEGQEGCGQEGGGRPRAGWRRSLW